MSTFITWFATGLGLIGGLVLAYAIGKAWLPRSIARSRDVWLCVRLALAGTVVALLPAILLSLVFGATLGSLLGAHVFRHFGVPSSGVPVGLALGIAAVFSVVLAGGAAAGILLSRAVDYFRARRARTLV